VRTLLDRMITASDDQAARTLLKLLHDLHQVDAMNAGLRALGLGTLQVDGTSPADGGRWSVGRITLTSLDTARLLLIVNGSPGVLWHGPDGSPVTADELSATSRSLLKGLLADQAWSDVLSTTDWCGRGYPAVGIPAPVAGRWIDPATGAVTVQGRSFRQDVRPCNDRAEVAFAHKTGWTFNFLADAGIVDSLPGVPSQRHYVVVLLSNLGYRYADAPESSGGNPPCYQGGVCYTQKVAQLGQAIDQLVR